MLNTKKMHADEKNDLYIYKISKVTKNSLAYITSRQAQHLIYEKKMYI